MGYGLSLDTKTASAAFQQKSSVSPDAVMDVPTDVDFALRALRGVFDAVPSCSMPVTNAFRSAPDTGR
jgi:hypothetical protein